MPYFRYKAVDRTGRRVIAKMQADNVAGVSNFLSKQGYIPVSIKEAPPDFSILLLLGKVSLDEVMMFTRQLWTLHRVGIPLQNSLVSLGAQTKNERFKKVITDIIQEIEGGVSLSAAMSTHPEVFDTLYVSMIKAGAVSGKLDEVLLYLAEMCRFEFETKAKIKAATRYPLLTLATLAMAFLMIVTFVIPKFTTLFRQFKAELPLPTRLLLAINYGIRHEWLLILLSLTAFCFLFRFYVKTERGKYQWDALKIKIPVMGPLLFNLVMSRFAKILSHLMSSGIPILESLRLVSETAGNAVIQKEIYGIQQGINEGKRMSERMEKSGFFSPMVVQMVAIGEQTGKTEELLNHVAAYYESQATSMINNLTTLIEPILILFLGGMDLFLALGIFLPMWDLTYVVR